MYQVLNESSSRVTPCWIGLNGKSPDLPLRGEVSVPAGKVGLAVLLTPTHALEHCLDYWVAVALVSGHYEYCVCHLNRHRTCIAAALIGPPASFPYMRLLPETHTARPIDCHMKRAIHNTHFCTTLLWH